MGHSFLDSWELFGAAYLAALGAGALLSLVGVGLLAKDALFESLAATQASVLGSLVALSTGFRPAWVLSTLGAVLAVIAGSRAAPGGKQRVAGWIFVAASGFSAVLLSIGPHGAQELGALTTSGLIGATASEAWTLGILATAALGFLFIWRRSFFLVLSDPETAVATGIQVGWITAGFALFQGLATGVSIEATGALFTASALLMPATAAVWVCRTSLGVLLLSPLFALTATLLALVVAHYMDLPHASAATCTLSGMAALAWGWGCLRRRLRN